MKITYLTILLSSLFLHHVQAQLNITSSASSADIQVCIDTQTVDITLSANGSISGNNIEIRLPVGVNYVPGSVNILSNPGGISITEASISNLQNPTFTFTGSMVLGEECIFQIGRTADCQTLQYRNAGNLLLDSVFATFNGGTLTNNLTTVNTTVIPFGLNEALTSISGSGTGGTIENLEGYPGDILTREIFINNGGLGCVKSVEFYVVDAANGIQINQLAYTGSTATSGSSPPTTAIILTPHTVNGDTSFYTLDIEALHGHSSGAKLCNGEVIQLEETVEILSCFTSISDGETRYGTYWNCGAVCQNINTTSANITNPSGVPNLTIANVSSSAEMNTDCFEGQTFTRTFRIRNTGTVDVVNYNFRLRVQDQNNSQTVLLAGTSNFIDHLGINMSITPTLFNNKNAEFMVDTVPAGEDVFVTIDVQHLCQGASTCGRFRYNRFQILDGAYEDPCGGSYSTGNINFNTGNRDIRIQNPSESNFPAINNGQILGFGTTFSDLTGMNGNSTLTWEIILPPCGVTFNNVAGAVDWGGNTSLAVSISGDTIQAEFTPDNSIYDNQTFNINLTGICGSCGTNQSIQKRLIVQTCSSDPNHCDVCLYSTTEALTIEDCNSGGSCTGMRTSEFSFARTNLGLPDNDNNRFADASGSLDLSLINRNRFIVFDTASVTIAGVVQINSGTPVYTFGYASMDVNNDWGFVDAEVEIFDASAGTSFTCAGVVGNLNSGTMLFDYSPSELAATCPSIAGFVFEDGDSVALHANLVVTTNANNIVSDNISNISIYVSEVANPTAAQIASCAGRNFAGIYELYNINPGIDIGGNGTFSSCGERRVDIRYQPKTGSNNRNIDIFPYEWRPISFADTCTITVPAGFVYNRADVNSFLGISTSAIDPVDPNANPLVFITGDLYRTGGIPSNPVQEPISDGLDQTRLRVYFQPTCETPNDVQVSVSATIDAFHPLPQLPDNFLDDSRTESGLRWRKPQLSLSTISTQTAEGINPTLQWDIRITNTTNNTDAANVFLGAATPSGNVTITDIQHIGSNGSAVAPSSLTLVNNVWQFGAVNQTEYHDFRVTATYSQCEPDTLFILSGFDCPAYPSTLSAYAATCEFDSLPLFTDPKSSTLQLNPIIVGVTDDICDTLTYSFTVNSADEANTLDPFLNLTLPQGIVMIGNPTIEYPLGTAPRDFTISPVGSLLSIDIGAANAQTAHTLDINTNGILGIREAANTNERQATVTFQFRTTCDFQSGSSFFVQPTGTAPCGEPSNGSNVTSFEPPIIISGIVPPYTIATNVAISGNSTCQDSIQDIYIELIPDGASTGRDTGYFDLPLNVVYAGNFNCSESDASLCPDFLGAQINPDGTTSMMVKYPSTWSLGDTINFDFDINTANFSGCSPSELIIIDHTVTMAGPTCDADGLPCGDIQVITGQANLNFAVLKPDLEISNVRAVTNVVTSGRSYSINFDIRNNGTDAPHGLIAEFYCADATGEITGVLLHSHAINVPILNNNTVTENAFFTSPFACNNIDGIAILITERTATGQSQCICQNHKTVVTDIPADPDLPLDWLYFDVNKQGKHAQLNWGTGSEINVKGFEVEHAVQSPNGSFEFKKIDFVATKGNGNAVNANHYGLLVENLAPTTHYFRLRQVDFDGEFSYSNIRVLTIDGEGTKAKIYPSLLNSSQPQLYLYAPIEDHLRIELYSILGERLAVLHNGLVLENSLNILSLDRNHFPAGNYIIRINGAIIQMNQKITISK
ncbi:MAG: hypothetical protein MK212_13555 [Saprospiraceae bacterium]|nr:hypothetical protein [Saprospiraceae bacterium]